MVFLRQILHNNRQRKERMKKFLITTVLGIATTAAFGAASLRAPQIGGTATVTTPTATNTARAGTMRAQTMKTSSISAPSVTTTQSIATPISTETTDARIALLKGIKGFNPGKVKDTTAAQQELNAIDSRIEELQNKLDAAESAQVNIESKTYTKDEIDTLIAESEQKVPKIDERGNWTDPNGGLIAVPEGAVVIGPNDITIVDGKLSTTSTHPVQNKTVTNAINEKQDKSTMLSLGAPNGEWRPLSRGDGYNDYIEIDSGEIYEKIRIKPDMIATFSDILNGDYVNPKLVTGGAIKTAIENITNNTPYYFTLSGVGNQSAGLGNQLQQIYSFKTNAPENAIDDFVEDFCDFEDDEFWCKKLTDINPDIALHADFGILIRSKEAYIPAKTFVTNFGIYTWYKTNMEPNVLEYEVCTHYSSDGIPCFITQIIGPNDSVPKYHVQIFTGSHTDEHYPVHIE